MKKNVVVIVIFILGLGIFFYPIVSNIFATKEHHTIISEYSEVIKKMEAEQIENEKKKAEKHNENLKNSPIDFVDPFSQSNRKSERPGNKSYFNALNIGPAIGSIEIPKIKVELPIYHGTSDDVLSQGVGHLENSSLPIGKPGNHSVLTAHRGLPSSKLFRNLDDLTIGDEFYIQMLDETLAYQVYDVEIVLPYETEWLQMNEGEDLVTLLTCEPYMINTHRMLVKGKRVPYNPTNKENFQTSGLPTFVYIAISLALLFLTLFIYRRIKKARIDHEI